MSFRNEQDCNLLTRSMVGRYRLGQEKTALFLAGSLFEGLINSKLIDQGGLDEKQLDKISLEDKIYKLNDATLQNDSLFRHSCIFTKFLQTQRGRTTVIGFSDQPAKRIRQVTSRLQNFRWLRNRIMHDQMDQVIDLGDRTKENLVTYLWSELAPESFEKALSKRTEANSIIETLYEHTADYMIRAIEEVEAIQRDRKSGDDLLQAKIFTRDFGNLFDLRRKLVPIKNFLEKWLPDHANFLKTDILTTIDTTSSYLWMPLVPCQTNTNEKRAGVYDCSVSLLATPLDLRIYMDFGGYDRTQRKLYYDFLSGSLEYDNVIQQFKEKPSFEVFDIDWYSCIYNRKPFSDWLSEREKRLVDAKKQLKSSPKPESSPLTWNRCLHGYVFSKLDLGSEHYIDFKMIEQPLMDVIKFYQMFQQYNQRISKGKSHD